MVHVYDITISSSLHLLVLADSLLNEAEHKRAKSYYQQKDRERFIVSRVALRQLLGKYLNQLPQDIVFTIGKNKKPFIQNASHPIHYNVTHSGDKILIAISDHEVGIDVEHIQPDFDFEEIIPTCFSTAEAVYIRLSNNPCHTFYLLWTRKEALLKATAKGIDDDLIAIPSLDGKHQLVFTNDDWDVKGFEVGEGYVGSVGCCLEVATITFHHFL
jgi:4'-phosphopantetheinyl transferase